VYWSEIYGRPQGSPPPPPQQLDRGSNWSLCCKEEDDLQGVEWNPGGMCDHSWLFTSLARSVVNLPIVGTEPRARPVISHVEVTNVATQH
jgi:hypothetical protein